MCSVVYAQKPVKPTQSAPPTPADSTGVTNTIPPDSIPEETETGEDDEANSPGLRKSEGNLDVAKRENSVILMEKDYQDKYEGFDPNSPEAHIYFSFLQSAYLDQSLKLAANVEKNFVATKRSSRGVKQAGLMVLWKSKMPSILIETGFLSNTKERAYLTSEKGQKELAHAIAKSVHQYKTSVEKSK